MNEKSIRERVQTWVGPKYDHEKRIFTHMISKLDVCGKRILDIGAGNGLASSFFVSESDAKEVYALDSFQGFGTPISAYEKIMALKSILGRRVKVIDCSIYDYFPKEKFGFIYACNSLHHISATKHPLTASERHRKRVAELFSRIGTWLENEGKFQIVEVARRNISPIPKYRRRFRDVIDLSSKQDPKDWICALKEAGFRQISLKFTPPFIFDRFKPIHCIFNNYFVSILTGSTYVITASNHEGNQSNSVLSVTGFEGQ